MLEIAANLVTTLSIWLAVRNSIHTWTTGIVGCALFMIAFFQNQLYADASLQFFFIATSIIGAWQWKYGTNQKSVSRTNPKMVANIAIVAIAVTAIYGWILMKFTNDFMPFVDASVLALSVVAQCLLMQRKLESWPFWIATNTISVCLYLSRGMILTAILYAAYWFNAWYGWRKWKKLMEVPCVA